MAAHYTRERSKYGTLSGSIIIWPVEFVSPGNPNSPDSIAALPAGYLRCNGAKYNAKDYPSLAEICGTGQNCKFTKFDENNEPLIQLGDDEFVVPDLGSKYPKPTSGGDTGVYNNIIEETQAGLFIKRSGIGITATSNVGEVADVTYSGKFVIPSQTIPLKGKPSWTWGTNSYTDEEAVDAAAIHPHMHFSSTNRVRIKPKSAATGGVIPLDDINYLANAGTINPQYNGTAFVGFGTGVGEIGGFVNPGFGSGYVAFGGTYSSSLITTRKYSVTLNFTGYTLLTVTAIVGNDANGGERPNDVGEGIFIYWPDGSKSTDPILPSRQESGLSLSSYDTQYASWLSQTLPIPAQWQNGTHTIEFRQVVVSTGDPAGVEQDSTITPPGNANCFDMCGIVRVGFSGGYTEDTTLTGGTNDTPTGTTYFDTASTIDVSKWLDATKYGGGGGGGSAGSNQPACWAIASGTLSGTATPTTQVITPIPFPITQYTVYFNFCDSGCSFSSLKCYCLLANGVTYDLSQNWFGFDGTRFQNYQSGLGICSSTSSNGVSWGQSGTAPATYQTGKAGVPIDWKGSPLSDVLPLNSNITELESFPQAKNVATETEEVDITGDPTIHNHKIVVTREDHTFAIVTDSLLLEPDALNTTIQLTPSTVASINSASSPFIVLEYLIKI
jgi:hypothetical protein